MNAREYLKIAALRGSKLGLERVTELCRKSGDPQEKLRIIHVAGTNGKGSFCAMLSGILSHSGYTAGGFSSPALTDVTESLTINGVPISDCEFEKIMAEIIPYCEEMDDKPTEFEVLTAAAYLYFYKSGCDVAVVECGMGGDSDSTNVISSPVLSVITNVAADHTAFLGDTIEKIARHKAGIIKPHRPVLYGGNNSAALEIIREISAKNNSPLTVSDMNRINYSHSGLFGTEVDFSGFGRLKTPLSGTYQQYNMANVLTAVEILRGEGFDIPQSSVVSGLSAVSHHGRFEIMNRDPIVIFDGAHNSDGIICAAESIENYFDSKVVLLIGVMADKEYRLYPEILGKFTERAFTVIPDNPRALDSEKLKNAFTEKGIPAESYPNVSEGTLAAFKFASENGLPLIALGSLYMYREFSQIYRENLRG